MHKKKFQFNHLGIHTTHRSHELRHHINMINPAGRLWNDMTLLSKSLEMKFDGLTD